MAGHLEILVEEPSAEAFLAAWLPRLLEGRATFTIHAFQGKTDLLANLERRLRGYARWLPDYARIIVLIDRDSADCRALKAKLEAVARSAGMSTRTTAGPVRWRVANRVVVEELEAWYFGAWSSVMRAYPNAPTNVPQKASFRLSDEIGGGTWEAFERVLQKAGYFRGGLRKVEAAQSVGEQFDPSECRSPSFASFYGTLLEAVSPPLQPDPI